MEDEDDLLSGFSEEFKEFSENSIASSKDNYFEWARVKLKEAADRFSWSHEEVVAVLSLMNEARNMAINDLRGGLMEQMRVLRDTLGHCPYCQRPNEDSNEL